MNEAELIKAVLAGRTERFEALVTRYMGLARGLCASHVRDSAAHDDLVQESFLYAYTKLRTLRNTNRFGPWLGSIVRSKCRDWLRRNRRAEEVGRALAAEASATTVSTPEDALMGKELREWVHAHIAHLPERTREAMFLCYAEGLEQKEAAAFLDIKLSALKKRLQYGREQLSERMWRELDDADRPKRDYPLLAGAVMVSLQSATPPVAAVAGQGLLAAALGSKPRMVSLGAAALVVAAVYTTLIPKASDPPPEIPATVVETANIAVLPEPVNDSQAIAPEAPQPLEHASLSHKVVNPPDAAPKKRGLTGLVVMEDTRAVVSGVEVELLTHVKRWGYEPTSVTTTGVDGTFSFPKVDPESQFTLRLGWPYRFAAKPFSRSWGRGSQPSHYILEAHTQGAITGYVRGPNGTPLHGAYIMREFPFGHTSNVMAWSDENGRYGFTHDGGIWRIRVKGFMALESEPLAFDLAQGEVLEQDFTMSGSASIRLTITTPDGDSPELVRFSKIELELTEILENGEHRTNKKQGRGVWPWRPGEEYTLPALGEGRYTITMHAPGFEPAIVGPIVIDSSFTDQYASVVFKPEGTKELVTSGAAVPPSEQDDPIEHISVKWVVNDQFGNTLNNFGAFVYALDESGELHNNLYRLTPGVYWMAAIKEGYGADIQYVEINAETSELTFTLAEGGTIYGSIAESERAEVFVYPVEIWELLGEPDSFNAIDRNVRVLGEALAQGAEADENGALVLPPLPNGWYVVLSHDAASEPVEVRAGHETGPVTLGDVPADRTD